MKDHEPEAIAEASGRDTAPGPSSRLSISSQRADAADDLKHYLSEWDNGPRNDGRGRGLDDDDEASEYELLLDPNLPEEYETRPRHSEDGAGAGEDDDDSLKRQDEDNSPYPEVRAAVPNTDEDLPCNTVRAWVIGLSLVLVGASMNTLFSLRQPTIAIGPLIAQIIAWPIGHGWARLVPDRHFTTFGLTWSLNPGPFNIKEHSIIGVMASVSFSVAYSTDVVLAQLVFYKQNFGIPFQLLLTISTQSLGYGIAGSMRKFLGMHSPDIRLFLLPLPSLPTSPFL